jgi:hypothetical protein
MQINFKMQLLFMHFHQCQKKVDEQMDYDGEQTYKYPQSAWHLFF